MTIRTYCLLKEFGLNRLFLGIDTSMYTTSVAVVDEHERIVYERRKLLEVDQGKLGLQQSVAVFDHLRVLPDLLEGIRGWPLAGVGVSTKPRNVEGSYMPVFKAGEGYARTIASTLDIPLFSFSHQENHLAATLLSPFAIENGLTEEVIALGKTLFVHLSGGTTELLLPKRNDQGSPYYAFEQVGGTGDISAGQLIDRIGVLLGMPFPCGPALEKRSMEADGSRVVIGPNPLRTSTKNGNIFFSGTETTLRKLIDSEEADPAVLCRHLEEHIALALRESIGQIMRSHPIKTIIIAGGVAANNRIRSRLIGSLSEVTLFFPEERFSGDHSVGVALLAKKSCCQSKEV